MSQEVPPAALPGGQAPRQGGGQGGGRVMRAAVMTAAGTVQLVHSPAVPYPLQQYPGHYPQQQQQEHVSRIMRPQQLGPGSAHLHPSPPPPPPLAAAVAAAAAMAPAPQQHPQLSPSALAGMGQAGVPPVVMLSAHMGMLTHPAALVGSRPGAPQQPPPQQQQQQQQAFRPPPQQQQQRGGGGGRGYGPRASLAPPAKRQRKRDQVGAMGGGWLWAGGWVGGSTGVGWVRTARGAQGRLPL